MRTNRRDGGCRKTRQIDVRSRGLDACCIVTDGKTETNYFDGLKGTLPPRLQSSVTIVNVGVPQKLVPEVRKLRKNPELRRYWIVFDRDEIPNFDDVVAEAERQGIVVGWSNPCFEVWLAGYLTDGVVPNYETSKECVAAFEKLFKEKLGKGGKAKKSGKREYEKNLRDIYGVLKESGDESNAIAQAKIKHRNEERDQGNIPSKMRCTTVHLLVEKLIAARDAEQA